MEKRYLTGIAGLRALAVLSVVAYHINRHWLPGGFVGVDLFFVISGFVVAHSVSGAADTRFTSYFLWFYRRRFRRILPAALAYILIATLAAFAVVPLVGQTKFLEPSGIAAIFGLSNIILYAKSGAYFALASDYNFFTHTWSLAVEEQYYVAFPFFSYFILIAGGRLGALRKAFLCAVGLACLLSLAAAAWYSSRNPSFAFYMLPTRFWELGLGFFLRLFVDSAHGKRTFSALAPLAPLLALAIMAGLAVSFVITRETAFPFPGALLPCLSTALLIALLWAYPGIWVDRLLSMRVFTWFGDISYSLYLWHWGVIVLLRWTVGIDTLPLQLGALAAMILLGWLSFRFIEQPVQSAPRLSSLTAGAFFLRFGAVAAGLAVFVGAAYLMKPQYGLAAANRVADWDPQAKPALRPGCAVDKQLGALGKGLAITFPTNCGRPNAPRLFVVGDSHAGGYFRAVSGIAASGAFAPKLMTLGGCQLVSVRASEPVDGCDKFRELAMQMLEKEAHPGDVILLAGLHVLRFPSLDADNVTRDDPVGAARSMALSKIRLKALGATGAGIIVEGAKPAMPFDLYRCADWFSRKNPRCAVPGDATPEARWHRMDLAHVRLAEIARSSPNIMLWEPSKLLCDHGRCEAYKAGHPLYFDTDHLSGFGNDLLMPSMLTAARSASEASLRARPVRP